MKRLSEFKDLEGIRLISKLMLPIGRIVQNKAVADARAAAKTEGRELSMLELVGVMLESGAQDIMTMLALLNETDPADYHCNAASVMADVLTMFGDPDMQALFGLQRQTTPSSGSASESTEGRATPDASSDTAEPASSGKQKKKSGKAMSPTP